MTTTTTKTTTKAKNWTRTVALPAGFELRSESGSWLLYGHPSAPAIDRTRAITVAISSGFPFLLVPIVADHDDAVLPFTALAPLRRVFPAWTVEADESTWARIFEIEAFIGALRIS